jgi:hypothetical protein
MYGIYCECSRPVFGKFSTTLIVQTRQFGNFLGEGGKKIPFVWGGSGKLRRICKRFQIYATGSQHFPSNSV